MVENKSEHIFLFEMASADIKLVEKNMRDKEIIPQILLFHLQQGAEKLLKSLISARGKKFPKVHDIAQIIETCEENTINLPDYIEDFIVLSPYAVDFRYGIMGREFPDIEDLYEKISRFMIFVKEQINC